jgi:hypothetical protein
VSPQARIEEGAIVEAPCFIDEGVSPAGACGPQRDAQTATSKSTRRSTMRWCGRTAGQPGSDLGIRSSAQCHIGRSGLVEDARSSATSR